MVGSDQGVGWSKQPDSSILYKPCHTAKSCRLISNYQSSTPFCNRVGAGAAPSCQVFRLLVAQNKLLGVKRLRVFAGRRLEQGL